MKRRAILLGNIDGQLATNLDLDKVYKFLTSLQGGVWEHNEIIKKANISRTALDALLNETRYGGYDYVFFYFSGHGKYERGTILELNPEEECISERLLCNLAKRQLNVYDCCRSVPNDTKIKVANSFAMDSISEVSNDLAKYFREIYNNRIMQAYEQNMSLYSCKIGEYSYDFGEGGVYTKYLIDAANNLKPNTECVLAINAHASACLSTEEEAYKRHKVQHPDYFMAKLPSRLQLPIAINVAAVVDDRSF